MASSILPKNGQGLPSQRYENITIAEQKTVNLSLMDFDADDTNWYAAKEILN